MCDAKLHRALLFRCMVVRLYWHFNNFPWLCKVFLQTFLHFASQFSNLKAILILGGDVATISKLGDHFAGNGQFRSPFLKLGAFSQQGVDFVEQGNSRNPFLSLKVISQLKGYFTGVSQLQNEGNCAANGTRVPKSGFAAALYPSKWCLGCEILAQLCALVFKRP